MPPSSDPPPAQAPPDRRRRIGREARRRRIEAAALEVFAESGYHVASLDEIARRAGIRKPVLYDHFRSKADLHLSLLEAQRDELLQHVQAELKGGAPDAAAVASALDVFFTWVQEHPYAWRMLFQETTGDPEVVEAHRRVRAKAHLAVVSLLLDQTDAATASTREREAIAALVGSGVNGLVTWWYDHPQIRRPALVELAMNVLWLGLERSRSGETWGA